jgi:hypothetical protein
MTHEVEPTRAAGDENMLHHVSRAAVDRFHAAALTHGARDDGAPGLRPRYGPDYYAAFIIDLDGHRIEAVIDEPLRNDT